MPQSHWKKTSKFAEARKLFPRARLNENMNINFKDYLQFIWVLQPWQTPWISLKYEMGWLAKLSFMKSYNYLIVSVIKKNWSKLNCRRPFTSLCNSSQRSSNTVWSIPVSTHNVGTVKGCILNFPPRICSYWLSGRAGSDNNWLEFKTYGPSAPSRPSTASWPRAKHFPVRPDLNQWAFTSTRAAQHTSVFTLVFYGIAWAGPNGSYDLKWL